MTEKKKNLPAEPPIGLTPAYWENPSRPAQARAFARHAGLTVSDEPGREIADRLSAFLLPVLEDLRRGQRSEGTWVPGGPWR